MRIPFRYPLFLVVTLAFLALYGSPKAVASERADPRAESASGGVRSVDTFGRLPLQFEANKGQVDGNVKFLSRRPDFTLFLMSTEAVISLHSGGPSDPTRSVLRMSLVGANTTPKVTGTDELPGKIHYFMGRDPERWRRNVPTYRRVRYDDVYQGVDLVYYGNGTQLEYDFIVDPGGDPEKVKLAFSGADKVALESGGDLVLESAGRQARMRKPVAYQEVDGRRSEVSCRFALLAGNQVGFSLDEYDSSKALVIDPVLVYSTYLGGTQGDIALSIAVDGTGSAYLTGFTSSEDFPTVNPFQAERGLGQAAFVSKLNPAGNELVYSTYIGASLNVAGRGIAVDSAGSAIVVGDTDSPDFPLMNPLQSTLLGIVDPFIAKLNPDGSALVYSTYFGGSAGDGAQSVAVDSSGNAYVSGTTISTDFPTLNPLRAAPEGFSDAWVAKLNPSGSPIYSTYLGGNGDDNGNSIAVDGTGSAYVAGLTSSTDLPTTPGAFDSVFSGIFFDAFVSRLDPTGSSLVFSTYLGGSSVEFGFGIAVTAAGDAWVTGMTESTDFPVVNPLQAGFVSPNVSDAFVTKLSASGAGLFSTYLGGSGPDSGNAIALDAFGNAYVAGGSDFTDFPVKDPLQPAPGGAFDGFLTKLSPTGSLIVYSTHFGGSGDDGGIGLAVSPIGRAFVTGFTTSFDFPTKDAYQAEHAGGFEDAFVMNIDGGLDYFLRRSGNNLVLQGAPPDSTASTFRDSAAVKFAGGNAWKDIGTWTATPPSGTLSTLGDLNVWLGLKNSDDVGTRFDVRVQLLHNGTPLTEGLSRCVQNLTRNPSTAKAVGIPFAPFSPVLIGAGDTLSLKVSTRIGTNSADGPCGGHSNATGLRFYFDSLTRPAGFGAGLAP